MQAYLLPTAVIALFGAAAIWAMTYLSTYLHFPKMERARRIALSASNATVLALILALAIFAAMYVLAGGLV